MTDPYPSAHDRCPWYAIRKCPLYIASHLGSGVGCVDDMARRCRVTRGEMNYHHGVLAAIRHGLELEPGQLDNLQPAGRA